MSKEKCDNCEDSAKYYVEIYATNLKTKEKTCEAGRSLCQHCLDEL